MNDLRQKNHFEKFSLAVNFEINLEELEQKYLQFQMQFHPDKSDLNDVENSVIINEAYEILKEPVRRASYILQLSGIDIEKDPSDVKPDMILLEKILNLQEEINQVNDSDFAAKLKKSIDAQLQQSLIEIKELLEKAQLQKAALKIMEAKYLKKSLSDLKKKERSIS